MDENEVIRRVVEELKAKGYTIVRTANTHDRGDDIVAHQNGKHLVIEAKGATSSKLGTKDYGQPWDKGKLSAPFQKCL